jgi:hypothetical protein
MCQGPCKLENHVQRTFNGLFGCSSTSTLVREIIVEQEQDLVPSSTRTGTCPCTSTGTASNKAPFRRTGTSPFLTKRDWIGYSYYYIMDL